MGTQTVIWTMRSNSTPERSNSPSRENAEKIFIGALRYIWRTVLAVIANEADPAGDGTGWLVATSLAEMFRVGENNYPVCPNERREGFEFSVKLHPST